MELIKQPVKGMRDILPNEKVVRDKVFEMVRDVYSSYGFSLIETPIVEHFQNLSCNNGGENEKLAFHILKRGEKLAEAIEKGEELCDSGLRYDLTMPLCRFYANNKDNLPYPFKVFQFGDVFRADRPQKGRSRQFKQCDIDIFGESGIDAEIELISATTTFLNKINGLDFTIKINDRRILRAMCDKVGFPTQSYGDVLVVLDKMDKIGIDGVYGELVKFGIDEMLCKNYVQLLSDLNNADDKLKFIKSYFSDESIDKIVDNLEVIIKIVKEINDFNIQFDLSIVRGMGYYTGTIYEIYCNNFGSAVGGGGRYDNMVGDFIGQNVPAVGISIGFERLVMILMENNCFNAKVGKERIAVLYDAKNAEIDKVRLYRIVSDLRKTKIVYLNKYNKNVKKQKDDLQSLGYEQIWDVKSNDILDGLDVLSKLDK